MLTVVALILLVVGIVIGVSIAKCYNDGGDSDDCFGRIITLVLITIAFVIVIGFVISHSTIIATEHIIDQKIEMYEEQNAKIEEDINILVLEYMKFESETYKDLKVESSITLVNLYPELKSDQLVQQQIELYRSNNDKIINLKNQKINLSINRWLVYFGR